MVANAPPRRASTLPGVTGPNHLNNRLRDVEPRTFFLDPAAFGTSRAVLLTEVPGGRPELARIADEQHRLALAWLARDAAGRATARSLLADRYGFDRRLLTLVLEGRRWMCAHTTAALLSDIRRDGRSTTAKRMSGPTSAH